MWNCTIDGKKVNVRHMAAAQISTFRKFQDPRMEKQVSVKPASDSWQARHVCSLQVETRVALVSALMLSLIHI